MRNARILLKCLALLGFADAAEAVAAKDMRGRRR
jgi:hypothetical protein